MQSVLPIGTDEGIRIMRKATTMREIPSKMATRARACRRSGWLAVAASHAIGCASLSEPALDPPTSESTAASTPVGGVCAGLDGGALAIPHKRCHIRIAQLAYNGTPQDSSMADQAANDVDLVVANDPAIRGAIHAASPT